MILEKYWRAFTTVYQPFERKAQRFFDIIQPDARRIFHGRGHLYPGLEYLSVDWFAPVVLITTYAEIDQPNQLVDILLQADKFEQISCILLQHRKRKGTPSECLYGVSINQTTIKENGLNYEVQPGVNQNAGLFLDMAPLRQWLRQNSKEKNILNLFAYTCSLSVAALAGDARQVVNVDMSKPSINWGQRNHEINNQDLRRVRSIPHNLFRSWGRIKQFGRYDTIIIDPPTRQRGSFDAEKNYGAVLKKLKALTTERSNIIATINSPYLNEDFLPNMVQRYSPNLKQIERLPIAPEFADRFPERALKIYHFRNF